MENLVIKIDEQIKAREAEIAMLKRARENLAGITIRASADEPEDGRYKGQKVGNAVRTFMQSRRSATLDEIREALDRGGIQWGKYPKRQVALVISNNPSLYALDDTTGVVTINQ